MAALWIVLGSACRIGEILQAKWEHIDFERREWIIPADNAKNGESHTVHLSDFVLKHLKTLQGITGHSEWCFPAENTESHVCLKSITKQVRDRQRNKKPMSGRSKNTTALLLSGGGWTPHDLRRTAATVMGQSGVLSEIIERCLNHTDGSKLTKIYQRNIPRTKMIEAWQVLGSQLEIMLADSSNTIVGNFADHA